jgi:hypothetical protein
MRPWSRGQVFLVVIVAALAISGSILVWPARHHDLGQALIGAAVLAGVVYPAVLRSRQRQR